MGLHFFLSLLWIRKILEVTEALAIVELILILQFGIIFCRLYRKIFRENLRI